LGKKEKDILAFIIGLLTYVILRYIPVISEITAFLTTVIGLGAWYLVLRNKEVKVSKTPEEKLQRKLDS